MAALAMTATVLPTASARPLRSSMAKQLVEAKRNGASKTEIKKLKEKIKDEMRTARAAGVSMDTLKQIQDRGTSLDEVKKKIMEANLKRRKKKGVFRKKETTLADVLFPGVSPEEFRTGASIPLLVDTVSSRRTQLPFEYYKLPVCTPEETKYKGKRKNLGERLMGNAKVKLSPYDITVGKDVQCTTLCSKQFDFKTMRRMKKLIARDYTINFTLDGLPTHIPRNNGSVIKGFPVGSKLVNEATEKVQYLLHNHIRFVIEYNDEESASGYVRIVGVRTKPVSVAHDPANMAATCGEAPVRNLENTLLYIKPEKNNKEGMMVTYSYEVEWKRSDRPWTDRWDVFLLSNPDDATAHHMSLLNSFMIVIFLAVCIAIILIRALRKDLQIYNELVDDDDEDESGWKMIHGDVFRPPSTSPMALGVCVGSGAQIAIAILATLLLSQTNLINPAMKGQALSNIVVLYVFSGTVSGYISARIFKFCGGKNWKLNTIVTAVAFPGLLMSMFLVLNVFLAFYGSSKTMGFFTIVAAFLLWGCVASPLVFIGSFIGFKRDPISVPTRTNQIARVIPPQQTLFGSKLSSLYVGALPFSCAVIEIYFLMCSIWMNQYYYLMGYLLAITILIGVCSVLTAIIMTYLRLTSEDHRWWWKSFADSASCGVWLYIYSIWYLFYRLNLVGILPYIVYLTYMAMISLTLGLYTGSISFIGTFYFNRIIYNSVKID